MFNDYRIKTPSAGIFRNSPAAGLLRGSSAFNPSQYGPALYLKPDTGVYSDAAADFSRADKEYLSIADNAAMSTGDIDYEVGLWVKFASTDTAVIISKNDNGSNKEYALYNNGGSSFIFGVFGAGAASKGSVTFTTAISTGVWYFVRAWHDATNNEIGLSVDNATAETAATTGALVDSTASFRLSGYDDNSFILNGQLDSVYFRKQISTAAEATSLYNSGVGRIYSDISSTAALSGFTTNLIAWYDLNEESGTRIDAHGTNDLTAAGAELVTNGAFTGNSTGWTEGAGWAYGTNNDAATAATADLSQATTAGVVGRRYKITYTVAVTTGSVAFTFGGVTGTTQTASGTYTEYTTATSTAALAIHPIAAFTGTIDDVSVTSVGPLAAAGIARGVSADVNFASQLTRTSNAYFTRANTASLQVGDIDFTWAGWLRTDSIGSLMGYITKWVNAGQKSYDVRVGTNGVVTLTVSADGTASSATYATAALVASTWYFVVIYHDSANNEIGIKLNNASITPTSYSSGVFAGTDSVVIGSIGNSLTNSFDGRVDNLGFWKRILTAAEQTFLYNDGSGKQYAELGVAGTDGSALLTNLNAWYEFETTGNQTDSSGNSNTLTAADAPTLAQGVNYLAGVVARLEDQSGNAKHATQTTITKRPAYLTNIQNGQPVVRGDGTDDVLTHTGINLAKTHTISLMVIPRTVTDAIIIGASSGNGYALRVDGTNFYYADGVNAAVSVAHGGFSANTAYIISVIRNGATVQFFKQGVQVGTDQTLAANDTNLTIGTLLAKHDSTSPLNGDIGESVKYSTNHSTAQRQAVERYLAAKYAITLS